MKNPAIPAMALAVLLLSSCEKETPPPVGVIRTVDHEYTLHAGPDGPLYTVRDESGREIASQVSRADLAARFPELKDDLESLWAGNDSRADLLRVEPALPGDAIKPFFPIRKD